MRSESGTLVSSFAPRFTTYRNATQQRISERIALQYSMVVVGPTIDDYDTPRERPHVDWISVDERWPPTCVNVLVLLRSGCFAVLNRWENDWYPGGIPCDDAIAWVHLPRPPRMTLSPVLPKQRARPKAASRGTRGRRKK